MAYLNGELVTGFGVNITPVVIDQQFDPTSENPQSGVAIAGALDDYVTKTYVDNLMTELQGNLDEVSALVGGA